jgi:hypothetical protein
LPNGAPSRPSDNLATHPPNQHEDITQDALGNQKRTAEGQKRMRVLTGTFAKQMSDSFSVRIKGSDNKRLTSLNRRPFRTMQLDPIAMDLSALGVKFWLDQNASDIRGSL